MRRGNLVGKTGIPLLVDTQAKVDALMESHARFYGSLQQLAEQTAESIKQLTESQKKTEATVDRLAVTVQTFIDSMRKGGNGSKS